MLIRDDFELNVSTKFFLEVLYRESKNDTIETLKDKLIAAIEQLFLLQSDIVNLIKGKSTVELEPHLTFAIHQYTNAVNQLERHELIELLNQISKTIAIKRQLLIRMMDSSEFLYKPPQ